MFWLMDPHALPPLLLASASPRRSELLARIGLSFELASPEVDEQVLQGERPCQAVRRLAVDKGLAVAALRPDRLVISADTLVVLDGRILGKPCDREEACTMLARLEGRWHKVYTGYAFHWNDGREAIRGWHGHQCSRVRFHTLTKEQIQAYVDTGEVLDKAGAYGIQDAGALLVAEIQGDYFNVMGLPVSLVARDLLARCRDWGLLLPPGARTGTRACRLS